MLFQILECLFDERGSECFHVVETHYLKGKYGYIAKVGEVQLRIFQLHFYQIANKGFRNGRFKVQHRLIIEASSVGNL